MISVPLNFKARIVYCHLLLIVCEHFSHSFKFCFHGTRLERFIPKSPTKTCFLRAFLICWLILTSLLSRVENIPLIALNILLEELLFNSIKWTLSSQSWNIFVMTYNILGICSFFSQGNSNSISTIDVSSGFVGLESYNLVIVGSLVVCNTYSLYILWFLMMFIRIKEYNNLNRSANKFDRIKSVTAIIITIRYSTVIMNQIFSTMLRHHISIWTVITPKFLYEAVLTILTVFLVCLIELIYKLNL